MIKYFMPLVLLVFSSFFVTDAFSVEIEILKESDRLVDTRGWLQLDDKIAFQEQIQILIDQVGNKNKISVLLISTNQDDIKIPPQFESAISIPEISAITYTSQFDCAVGKPHDACMIVLVDTEMSDDLPKMKDDTREIADKVVEQGILGIKELEFHSNTIVRKDTANSNIKSAGAEIVQGKVIYTMKKHQTEKLFDAWLLLLLNEKILQSGGFFDYADKLSENYFSELTLMYIPGEQNITRVVTIAFSCSNDLNVLKTGQYPRCLSVETNEESKKLHDDTKNGKISPLEFLDVENINRSSLFLEEFLPLNSVIQVIIESEQELQIESVNSSVLTKLNSLGDVQNDGWFFVSKTGNQIDGRYIFGTESSVSKNDLAFSVVSYSGDDTEIKEGGGCLIATAAFGSEIAPQVQFLREIRDNTVLQTEYGSSFMNGFNQFYYSFSPVVADYERENPAFKETVKITLTPLLTSLALLNYVDIDSEHEMLGYGIGVILLNIGMYFVAPAILIIKIKKLI